MALAQQQTDSNSTAQQPQAVGYENDDGTNDIDGTTAGDTGDANLEPLRSGNVWNITAGGTLTYSYYDGVTPYSSTYNASTGTPGTPAPVSDYGAGNEVALDAAFDAWDETVDFTFSEVTENGAPRLVICAWPIPIGQAGRPPLPITPAIMR